jgi:hypothetical protein
MFVFGKVLNDIAGSIIRRLSVRKVHYSLQSEKNVGRYILQKSRRIYSLLNPHSPPFFVFKMQPHADVREKSPIPLTPR